MRRMQRASAWMWMALLVGCQSTTGPELTQRLVGGWAWLDSTGGIAGATRTPATEGFEMSLRFYESDEVELFRDGVSQVRTGFTYFVEPNDGSDHIAYDQPLFGFESARVELLQGDTLLLIDPCCDGFLRRWVP